MEFFNLAMARGSGIVKLNSSGGSTLQCGTWLWDDITLNSLGDSTLKCGMWLWDHDIEFTKWKHPAMWHVARDDMSLNSPGGSTV